MLLRLYATDAFLGYPTPDPSWPHVSHRSGYNCVGSSYPMRAPRVKV